jgi:DNA-binding response OmpR family regulator
MHALIIEDEFMIATVIEYVLRDCGFDSFDFAPSIETAIAAAERRRPDLITADVGLNSGSGLEAVAMICEQPSIPVIFITGSAAQVRDEVSRYAVLNKPFSEQTLTYAVAASLAR